MTILSTLGYFLGWFVGFLAAMLALTVAKELIVAGIALYAVSKIIDYSSKFFDKKVSDDEIVELLNKPVVVS